MRESLTVVAALLILCLSIALAAPYFVDWNAQRGLFEAQLSKALGEKVSIQGNLDLKLLPTPYLHLQKIDISDEGAAAQLSAEDVFLELAIPPLLRGEFDFIEARVQRPHLKLHRDPDGTMGIPQPENFSGQARFERIVIEDGKIEIDDPTQSRGLVLDHLDLSAEANSLSGPFKGDGSSSVLDEKTAFRFSTGAREADHLRLKLIVDKSKTHPRADFDGTLSFEPRAKNRIAASFKGNTSFSGLWRGNGDKTDSAVPWQLSGPLQIAGSKAAMDTLDLRLGDEDHAIAATGKAELDFSAAPKASASLRARQIDLDRFSADTTQTKTPETRERNLAAALGEVASKSFPLPLTLEATAETATLNGETLSDLSGAMAFNEGLPLNIRFEGNLPGRSHLMLDGRLEPGAAMKFDGRVDASSSELGRMTNWLAGLLPRKVEALRKLPFQNVDIRGGLSMSRVGFSGRDLSLRLDRSMFAGTLSYTQAVGREPSRFFADVNSPSLDLDGWPNLQDAAKLTDATDLSIRLAAHTIKVSGLRKGTVDTGEIRVKLDKGAGKTTLEDLTLTRPGGINVSARGVWTGQTGSLDAKLNLPQLADMTDLLQHLVPEDMLSQIDRRAAVLSPMRIDLHTEAATTDPLSPPSITALTLSGTAGATSVKANVKSDPQIPANSAATATLDAPDSGALLRQLGVPVLPLGGLARGHIEFRAQGRLNGMPDATIQAALAGLDINFQGRIETPLTTGLTSFAAAGPLRLTSQDVSPFLQATGLAFPDLTGRLPGDLSADLDWRASRLDARSLKGSFAGTAVSGFLTYALQNGAKKLLGSLDLDKASATSLLELVVGAPQPSKNGFLWSGLSFGVGLPDPPAASLTLHAKAFDIFPGLSGENAAAQLEITPGAFTFRDFTMKTGSGTAAGTIALRRDGPTAAVAGHIAIQDYALDLPSLKGHASASFEFSGSGSNALALMSSLAGSGHASLGDIMVRRADPTALTRIFADVEHDRLNVDQTEVDRALGREFDRGSLDVGTRPFDLAIASGVMRLTSLSSAESEPKGNPVVVDDLSLSLDLRTAAMAQKVGLALTALPRDWQGAAPRLALEFKGPLTGPARTIESANFVNALAARAIAREAARIQAYEFDLHERAFFNQRLLLDRRHDEEERKAEEEARKAEAARKAEEIAKIEKLRKAEEVRKKAAEEPLRAGPETPPVHEPSSTAQSPQRPVPPDPSTLGRY